MKNALQMLFAVGLFCALSVTSFADEMSPLAVETLHPDRSSLSDLLYVAERCGSLYLVIATMSEITPGAEKDGEKFRSRANRLFIYSQLIERKLDYSKSYVENDVDAISMLYATSARASYVKSGRQLNKLLESDLISCNYAENFVFAKSLNRLDLPKE